MTAHDLTLDQRRLYLAVMADYSGRDLRDVLAETSAPETDKAAVAEVLGGAGAGQAWLGWS